MVHQQKWQDLGKSGYDYILVGHPMKQKRLKDTFILWRCSSWATSNPSKLAMIEVNTGKSSAAETVNQQRQVDSGELIRNSQSTTSSGTPRTTNK